MVTTENESRQTKYLFIVCDDLRPELGCYGRKQIKSPNIDRWATQSVLFDRAYCNIAVSGASRASLLTGLRPTKNLLQTWNARTDVDVPDAVTIQKCFRDAGYITIANGKIYHHQDEASMKYWDDVMPPVPGTAMGYHSDRKLGFNAETDKKQDKGRRGYFYEHGDFPEKDYLDWQIADKSIQDLKKLKKQESGIVKFKSMNGEDRYLAYEPLGYNNWYVFSVVPGKCGDQPDHNVILIAAATWFLVALVLSGIICYLYMSRVRNEKKIDKVVFYDELTSHYNYNKFRMDVQMLLDRGQADSYALIEFDVSDFKLLNELYGYQGGDQLLITTMRLCEENCSADERCARISADRLSSCGKCGLRIVSPYVMIH